MPKLKLSTAASRKKAAKDAAAYPLYTNADADAERHAVTQWLDALFEAHKHQVTDKAYAAFKALNPAANIEKGLYNATIQRAMRTNIARQWSNPRFLDAYRQRKQTVLANLDPASYVGNTLLLRRLMNQEMLPHTVAFLKPEELFPERWATFLQEQAKEAAKGEYVPTGYYTQYKCGKCGERKTTITEVQIRSADEPMTQFITCLVCKHKWRR